MTLFRATIAAALFVAAITCLWLAMGLSVIYVQSDTPAGLANLFVVRFVSVCLFLAFLASAAASGVIVLHSDSIKRFFND